MDLTEEQVIIGIDIGYTCTGMYTHQPCFSWFLRRASLAIGVAFGFPDRVGRGREPIKPYPIQNWPNYGQSGWTTNKVPTLVGYKAADFNVRSWGFGCLSRNLGPNTTVCSLFKFLLDKKNLEKLNEGRPKGEEERIENVRKWFTDFLIELDSHIVDYLADRPWCVDWKSAKIQYIFGLPTSWENDDDLVREFKEVVDDAGFGSDENSSVTMGLTEGVASAVYTAKRADHDFHVGSITPVIS
jgi:hypothetical protein